MSEALNYWPLLGVAWVVVGFVLRMNPVIVVVSAGLVSGIAAGKTSPELLALLGESCVSNRALLMFAMTLPTIGLLERAGLREHALRWIAQLRGLTLARLLTGYLALRQGLSTVGLIDIAGHAQTVRPLLAPMSESAAEKPMAPCPATRSSACMRWPPPPTTSGASSAKTCSSPSARCC